MRKSAKQAGGGSGAKPGGTPTGAPGDSEGEGRVSAGGRTATATSAPVGVADAPEGDVEAELWPNVLARIRRQKPALAAFLNDAVASRGDGAVLELVVPNGSRFHKEQLKDRGNMRLMESAAVEVFGGRVRFAFTFGEALQERASSRRAETHVSEETAEDPVVRKVLDMFGGEIRGSSREE